MRETASTDGPLVLRPDMACGADLPEHLKGSRAAIFHLLRVGRAQKEKAPRPAASAAPSPPPRHRPRPAREQVATAPAPRDPVWQGFFVEDQFEFLTADPRAGAKAGRVPG